MQDGLLLSVHFSTNRSADKFLTGINIFAKSIEFYKVHNLPVPLLDNNF